MLWTKEKSTWLGTSLEKRGRWHGIPFVVRGYNTQGLTSKGWVILALAALLLIAVTVFEELAI